MAVISVNLSNVADLSAPLPKGNYHMLIKDVTLKNFETGAIEPQPGNGKYPYLSVKGEVVEGEYAGRTIWCNCTTDPTITERGSAKNWMLFLLLKSTGLCSDPDDLQIDTDAIVGCENVWKLDIDTQDTNRNAVRGFLPI